MIKFLAEKPALVLNEEVLVIGDLHIGIEHDLYKSGISILSRTEKMRDEIISIVSENKLKRVIILGDLKHNIPEISEQEKREIPDFLSKIRKYGEIDIVPGNHDGNLKKIIPKSVKLHSMKGFLWDKFYFNHGHAWPKKNFLKAEYIFISHVHPSIKFVDSMGYRSIQTCWARCPVSGKKIKEKYGKPGKIREAVIVPPFNPLVGTVPLNQEISKMGPLIRNNIINLKECEIYLLDGTYLGKLRNIKSY